MLHACIAFFIIYAIIVTVGFMYAKAKAFRIGTIKSVATSTQSVR